MNHSLVGKIIKIYHNSDMGFPYQPMRILAIEEPMIQLGCTHPSPNPDGSGQCVHPDKSPRSFWVPLMHCRRIDVQEEGRS